MKISVNNIELNYIKTGQGQPLVLLHGNGEDYHIFDKLAEKLSRKFTIYAVDSRNHGGSSKTNDLSYEAMAEDIYQFINKLRLAEVGVIGFSDGAIISLLIAMRADNPIKKMALLGINLKPTDFKKGNYNYLVAEYEKTKDPLFKMMLEQPDIELAALKNVNLQTLVMAGQDDLFYRKTFVAVAETIPRATLKIMKGHDHSSYIIDQDILYPDFLEFFQ